MNEMLIQVYTKLSMREGNKKMIVGYKVLMKLRNGTVEQYGLFQNKDWAIVQLEKAESLYWMKYESFYIEEVK